jgi:hypothetical protein
LGDHLTLLCKTSTFLDVRISYHVPILLEEKAFRIWGTYPSNHVEYIEESTGTAFNFTIYIVAILVFVLCNASKNILSGKLEWKRLLGIPSSRWDVNIKNKSSGSELECCRAD